MPSALAFRHLPHENLGGFLEPLEEAGYAVRYAETPIHGVDRTAAEAADVLFVLGGPCGAYETENYRFLADEIAAVRERLAGDRPTLGVCLGAQIIVRALGGEVRPGGRVELGWGPVMLTDAGRAGPLRHLDGVPIMHWHADTFDLPDGCDLLASTPAYAHQAFARGPNVLGLQCHPEIDGRDFEHSIIGKDSYLAEYGLTVRGLREQARALAPAAGRAGAAMLSDWLAGLRR